MRCLFNEPLKTERSTVNSVAKGEKLIANRVALEATTETERNGRAFFLQSTKC